VNSAPRPLLRCQRNGCREIIPPGKITCVHCGAVAFGAPKSSNPNDFGIVPLSKVEQKPLDRYATGFADRLWGPEEQPGIVTSSVTLFAGEPGVGKSTFFLQLLHALFLATKRPGIYKSLEESAAQVLDRAMRIGVDTNSLLVLTKERYYEGKDVTRAAIRHFKPSAVVIDSIQKETGGIREAVELCGLYKNLSQTELVPFFVICQINTSDDFAGGKGMQHEPDTLIYMSKAFEIQGMDKRIHAPPDLRSETGGTEIEPFRIAQVRKNRFGTEGERYFIMRKCGLVSYDLPPPDEDEDEDDEEEHASSKRRERKPPPPPTPKYPAR